MVHYRRNLIKGGTYFFTVAIQDRKSALLVEWIDELRAAVRAVRHENPFHIDAWVVLPDHLHAMWTLPQGDDDYPGRWRAIKSHFTRAIVRAGATVTRNANGEYNVWQRRFWEHTIRDARDFEKHMDYIHYNPVKHGHARHPGEWPHSTFQRWVSQGVYPKDWGGYVEEEGKSFGE